MQIKPILATTVLLALAIGAQGQTYQTLYNFAQDNPNGIEPYAGVIFDQVGNLYGVAAYTIEYSHDGTLFKLTPSPSGWNFSVLHEFEYLDPLGREPMGGLAVDENRNIYGTNSYSDDDSHSHCGTIFKGDSLLYQFTGPDGCVPLANLTYDNGSLWGTTVAGGSNNHGTVFTIRASGSGFQSYSFRGRDGAEPVGGVNRWHYGAAKAGGSAGVGTIYWVTPSGRLDPKHSFQLDGKAGYAPKGDLLTAYVGNVRTMYGTTSAGGQGGGGTVYRLTESQLKPGNWRMTVLHSFSGADGSVPQAGLSADQAGNLYGTTSGGGDWGCGTVFKLSLGQDNKWMYTVVYSFNPYNEDSGGDGCYPTSGVVLDAVGNLYGTTARGGWSRRGTVYKIVP